MLTFAAIASPEASAQYKLPSLHSNQHESLIANQRPAGAEIKVNHMKAFLNDLRERESELELDNEIFSFHWNSESVNPYNGVEIPSVKDIDVSTYVPPVPGAITSNYGYRRRFGRVHRGTDLRLSIGDTVVSAFDGKVRLTKYEGRGYGYYVVVRHDNGMETVYGHLSKFLVKPNQRVKAGEPIALGGNTGRSTGPHLHFETRYMGLAINPTAIIDFENGVPHKDIFTFDHNTYKKSQNYGPVKRSGKSAKRKSKARRSKSATASKSKSTASKSKTTASKKKSTSKKSTSSKKSTAKTKARR